jgi:hypothetical protein
MTTAQRPSTGPSNGMKWHESWLDRPAQAPSYQYDADLLIMVEPGSAGKLLPNKQKIGAAPQLPASHQPRSPDLRCK